MRYIVPNILIDHFGGCLDSRANSRAYYNTGIGDAPAIAKYRKSSRKQYFAIMGRRTTPPSAQELAARQHFASVAARVAAVYATPSLKSAAMVAFKAQTNKKTLRAFVWSQADVYINTTTAPAT